MIATIEGNVRGVKEISTAKGKLFVYKVEMKDRQGIPYILNVVSLKNGLKSGQQALKVNIRNQIAKDGRVLKGFKLWAVD